MTNAMAARMPLLCFPPAGGLARFYDVWRDYVPDWLDIVGVEYPGHGCRSQQAPISDIEALADDIVENFSEKVGSRFAVLGVSMGGLVAFEFAVHMTKRRTPPLHLFVFSCRNPRQRARDRLHELPEEQFIDGWRRRQGINRLTDGHAGRVDTATLRADVTASECYVAPIDRHVSCPISVLSGEQDPLLPRHGLAQWCLLTSSSFFFEQLPGGHFFFRHGFGAVAARIVGDLQRSQDLHSGRYDWDEC
jgi:surfactin synthase thioesterase subunit